MTTATPVVDRIMAKVEHVGECWQFTGCLTPNGYARIRVGADRVAHRVMYEQLVGPIPEGLDLDHLCRNRACVNPGHLEPVTRSENLLRGEMGGYNRSKTRCRNGHPYDERNTRFSPDRKKRYCKRCGSRAFRAAKKLAAAS